MRSRSPRRRKGYLRWADADRMPRAPSPGWLVLRAHVAALPSQLLAGFNAGVETLGTFPRPNGAVYVVGLGGSAIGPDLVRALVEFEAELDLHVVRGPTLPRAAQSGAIVILVSYSGETWETLAAYDEAQRRRCVRLVVASGGELTRRAIDDRVPHVPLPPGLPPRAAVGFLVGAVLGLLDSTFPESNDRRIATLVDRLRRLEAEYASERGAAAVVARRIGAARAHIYANGDLVPVAHRWATQIEENSKRLATFDELPEALHNVLVGWDAIPLSAARREIVIVLEAADTPPPIATGIRFLESRLRARGVPFLRVPLPGTDRLETQLAGVLFGDHVSLFLALRAGVDPLATPVLTAVKASLAVRPSPTRRPGARTNARRGRGNNGRPAAPTRG
jgi:glucose/mannose-6-phosphate isomerase